MLSLSPTKVRRSIINHPSPEHLFLTINIHEVPRALARPPPFDVKKRWDPKVTKLRSLGRQD